MQKKIKIIMYNAFAIVMLLHSTTAGFASMDSNNSKSTLAQTYTIFNEGFERGFPGSLWINYDCGTDSRELFWDDEDYMAHSGSRSAWPVGGGQHAYNPYNSNYPDNACTRMELGPINLVGVHNPYFSFWYWLDTEGGYDYFSYYFFCKRVKFPDRIGGKRTGNSNGWSNIAVSLHPCLNDSNVYIGFRFLSNGSEVRKGVFVDDIKIFGSR